MLRGFSSPRVIWQSGKPSERYCGLGSESSIYHVKFVGPVFKTP